MRCYDDAMRWKALHLGATGNSSVSPLYEKLQVGLPLLGPIGSKYAYWLRVCPLGTGANKNPLKGWDAFCSSWVAVFGRPKVIEVDEGGGWENDIRADFRAERQIKLQFQGKGARPRLLELRNGLARGICRRSVADDRRLLRRLAGIRIEPCRPA